MSSNSRRNGSTDSRPRRFVPIDQLDQLSEYDLYEMISASDGERNEFCQSLAKKHEKPEETHR